jgi:hypothetical protein
VQFVHDKRDYNAAGVMSMFHKPIVAPDYVKRHRSQADAMPGPGSYETVRSLDADNPRTIVFLVLTKAQIAARD